MTAIKPRDVEAFILKPDISVGMVLVYGPDAGKVRETGQRLSESFMARGEFTEPTILEGDELSTDPARLAVELDTQSLFGGKPLLRLRNTPKSLAAHLKPFADQAPDAILIMETGALTPRDALRQLAESQPGMRALPCYADDDRIRLDLIRSTLREADIQSEPGLVEHIAAMLGNDREVTRRELEKLVLFAGEGGTLSRQEVSELCGDNAALALDMILDAAGSGHAENLNAALERAQSAAIEPQRILAAALQHFLALRHMRAEYDGGKQIRALIESQRPKPHFSRIGLLENQVRAWNERNLGAACTRLYQAIASTRRSPRLSLSATQRTLLAICRIAASQQSLTH